MLGLKRQFFYRILEGEQTRFDGLTRNEIKRIKNREKHKLKNVGIKLKGHWYGEVTGIVSKIRHIDELMENDVVIIDNGSGEYDAFIVLNGDKGDKLLSNLNNCNGTAYGIKGDNIFKEFDAYIVYVNTKLRKSKADYILAMISIIAALFLEMPKYRLTFLALNIIAVILIIKSNYLRQLGGK